ncbi:MAG: hypothetical protein K2X81_10120, partial [Candidatus Obscuribacterales bacterium]|nr:hypothetical protein [Candidatus Obscuribacterales bacterium]
SCSRNSKSHLLDMKIIKELAPVYAAYDGGWESYPFEISILYAFLRRTFELGPLHVDTLQNLYRLSNIYAHELFGCYDSEFALAGFRICIFAFKEHPEIEELARIRCRTSLASVLIEKGEHSEAKEVLKEAIVLADACEQVSRHEMVSILQSLAECIKKLDEYDIAAAVYERIRNFQEAVSRGPELFDTLLELIYSYNRIGQAAQVHTYSQRVLWEIDWVEDPNPLREATAIKAYELQLYEFAEQILNDILSHTKPFEPIAGRAVQMLINVYDSTGRTELASKLKTPFKG